MVSIKYPEREMGCGIISGLRSSMESFLSADGRRWGEVEVDEFWGLWVSIIRLSVRHLYILFHRLHRILPSHRIYTMLPIVIPSIKKPTSSTRLMHTRRVDTCIRC